MIMEKISTTYQIHTKRKQQQSRNNGSAWTKNVRQKNCISKILKDIEIKIVFRTNNYNRRLQDIEIYIQFCHTYSDDRTYIQ
jgi:hypothetical protein